MTLRIWSVLLTNRVSTSLVYNKVEAVGDFGVRTALTRNHSAGTLSTTSSNASTTARQTRQPRRAFLQS